MRLTPAQLRLLKALAIFDAVGSPPGAIARTAGYTGQSKRAETWTARVLFGMPTGLIRIETTREFNGWLVITPKGKQALEEVEKMNEAKKDTARATAALKVIVDSRRADDPAILVTLEHVIAAALILTEKTPEKAAAMLNEAVTPGVELRLIAGGRGKQ